MKPSELLAQSREVLRTKGWTRGAFARSALEDNVDPTEPAATCFCSMGAIHRAMNLSASCSPYPDTAWVLIGLTKTLLQKAGPTMDVFRFNDQCETVDEVLAWFDRAIELAKKEETPETQ